MIIPLVPDDLRYGVRCAASIVVGPGPCRKNINHNGEISMEGIYLATTIVSACMLYITPRGGPRLLGPEARAPAMILPRQCAGSRSDGCLLTHIHSPCTDND